MSAGPHRPFVSVKFSPVGRTYTFLLPELALDADPSAAPKPTATQRIAPAAGRVSARRCRRSCRRRRGARSGPLPVSVSELAARKSPPDGSELQVVRRATREDVVTRLKHQQREQEAQRICLMKIRERGLAMKLARVEQLFDGSRLIFYYTAEGRVDFRELVRDLAAHFRVRIEMRQIGVRDEARMLGGYGSCGRPLCCTTFLQTFEPISIKMAKQQNLSLNPSKLSGMCGRLKCCLRYELPNGKGVKHGGCADEGGCGSCSNPTGPGGEQRLRRVRTGRLREVRVTARPRIGVTVGDPAGIGPEIARKAAADPARRSASATSSFTVRRRTTRSRVSSVAASLLRPVARHTRRSSPQRPMPWPDASTLSRPRRSTRKHLPRRACPGAATRICSRT